MRSHFTRQIPLTVVLGLALAMLALGFLAALGVRSLVARTASAEPAAPNPGHSWGEIGDLPGTMWHSNNDGPGSGLDADMVDGKHPGQTGTNYVPYADAWGNVGIGTTSPVGNLEIEDTSSAGARLRIDSGANNEAKVWLSEAGSYRWVIRNAGAEEDKLMIDGDGAAGLVTLRQSGNLGVGTTSPNARLQVSGGDAAVTTQGNGVILRATDGSNCYRLTVNNTGTVSTALVSCP